jgi:hypothetical protein
MEAPDTELKAIISEVIHEADEIKLKTKRAKAQDCDMAGALLTRFTREKT